MKDKAFGTLFWVMVIFLAIGITVGFAWNWFADVQDHGVGHIKKTEQY
jgi:F0F1-type ATP synthase assembly protein I